MARKADTSAKAGKTAKSRTGKPTKSKAAAPKTAKVAAAKVESKKSVARARKSKSALEAVRTPVLAASTQAKAGSAKVKTKVKNEAKKAMKSAKKQARGLMSDFHMPSLPHVSAGVSDTFKSIGTQIAGALNTDVGRVMMAEILIYVAKSLTKTAASTEAAHDAKTAILNAGAKIGAVAADAGARMVETGQSAAQAGGKLVESGRKVAGEGADSAVKSARGLVREVAQVAVGAVGGAVVDAAQKVIRGRTRREPDASAPGAESGPGAPDAGPVRRGPGRPAGSRPTSAGARPASSGARPGPKPRGAVARPETSSPAAAAPSPDTAPATAADAGHRPPVI